MEGDYLHFLPMTFPAMTLTHINRVFFRSRNCMCGLQSRSAALIPAVTPQTVNIRLHHPPNVVKHAADTADDSAPCTRSPRSNLQPAARLGTTERYIDTQRRGFQIEVCQGAPGFTDPGTGWIEMNVHECRFSIHERRKIIVYIEETITCSISESRVANYNIFTRLQYFLIRQTQSFEIFSARRCRLSSRHLTFSLFDEVVNC